MAQYIDKDALVAEIERIQKKNNESESVYDFGVENTCKKILSFLDTLEVKEVDSEEETKILIWNNMTEEEKSDFFYNLSHQK